MSVKGQIARKGDPALADTARFGAKAAGLAQLDPAWTPPFIALAVGLHAALDSDQDLKRALASTLHKMGSCADGVLVRSSAVDEGLHRRGTLESDRCAHNVDEVSEVMCRIAEDTPVNERSQLAFVIQRWIPEAAIGHLSNERRASRDKRSWLCEAELPPVSAQDRTFRFRVDSDAPSSSELSCPSFDELAKSLRGIAKVLSGQGNRVHLEWIWDGERVWIVQCDHDETRRAPAPGVDWTRSPGPPIGEDLSFFRMVDSENDTQGAFPKVNHVRIFKECGLPHGDIRVLADADVIKGLASGKISPELLPDLRALAAAPLVIRTDFKSATDKPVVLSRRTDTCLTLEALESFLTRTAKEVLEEKHDASQIAFLAHRFLRARAGAFSYAQPGNDRVHIDATWGFPDSLLFHPHDSYRVDVANTEVTRYLRCKTDYIDIDSSGKWRSRSAGRPWDWKPTLTDAQAVSIAKMSLRLAEHLGKRVEIMFLISEEPNDVSILPWFFTSDELRISQVQAAPGFYVGEKVLIRHEDDLTRLESKLSSEPTPAKIALTLRPDFGLLRSRPFIQNIAELAKRWSLPIELEGSQSSHAYYLLESGGAGIRCVNPWTEPERRQSFGKLVRDLVPVKIERHGEHAVVYHADRNHLISLVKDKLVEEALEYYWESDKERSVEELADLLELLKTAAKAHEVSFDMVEQAAAKKRDERGGFEAGVVLVETRHAAEGPHVEPAQARSRALDVESGSRRNRLLTSRRVRRLPGRRLVLPLVPPSGWSAGDTRALSFEADEEVMVMYGSDEIVLQVRPKAIGPGRDQLLLFDPQSDSH